MIIVEDDDYPEPAMDNAKREAQEPQDGLLVVPSHRRTNVIGPLHATLTRYQARWPIQLLVFCATS